MTSTYDTIVGMLTGRFEVEPAAIRPGVTFDELEMDSLFLVELLLVVQSDLGVKLDEESLSPHDTIERAAELIDQQLTAATP
jgi:acyl carrier protein